MGNTDPDSLLELSTRGDMNSILWQIREQVENDGEEAPAPLPVPVAEQAESSGGLVDALRAQAQFNHDLMAALTMLGQELISLRNDVSQLQEPRPDRVPALQVSIERLEGRSAAFDQDLEQLCAGMREMRARQSALQKRVAHAEARHQSLDQRTRRHLEEMHGEWQDQLAKRETSHQQQFKSHRVALDGVVAWLGSDLQAVRDQVQSELTMLRELVSAQTQTR